MSAAGGTKVSENKSQQQEWDLGPEGLQTLPLDGLGCKRGLGACTWGRRHVSQGAYGYVSATLRASNQRDLSVLIFNAYILHS